MFGNLYGSPKAPVVEALEAGSDMVFDIDWQGGQQIKQAMRDDVVSVFVLPPSIDELERRLRGAPATEPPHGEEAHEVHEPVPADLQGAERQGDGIGMRIDEHEARILGKLLLECWGDCRPIGRSLSSVPGRREQ